MSPGSITIRTLLQRRGSLGWEVINSSSAKTICGCLLRAQTVIQSERSQTRPAETFCTPLRQNAVTTKAEQRPAPSALSTERLKSDTGSIAISTNAHFSTGLTLIAYAVTAVKAARPN